MRVEFIETDCNGNEIRPARRREVGDRPPPVFLTREMLHTPTVVGDPEGLPWCFEASAVEHCWELRWFIDPRTGERWMEYHRRRGRG